MFPSAELPPVVLVAGYPPNTAFGGGVILRGLFGSYPESLLRVVSGAHVRDTIATRADGGGMLPSHHDLVRPWRATFPGLRRFIRTLNTTRVPALVARIRGLLQPGSVLVAVPWGGEFGSELFSAAYIAHRLSHRPLVVYEMDEWRASLGSTSGQAARLLERLFHGPILRAARTVWVMSHPMAEAFHLRFGIESRVLPHGVELGRFAAARPEFRSPCPFRVLFGGAVYGAQADALGCVAEAVRMLSFDAELVLHTDQSADELAELGVGGKRVVVLPAVPVTRFPVVLKGADVLLLPLSFGSSQREVVKTSFPTKAIDYMAASVPILVHAPPESAAVRRARSEGWGLVVDKLNPAQVAAALERLAQDDVLRRTLVERSWRTVQDQHDFTRNRDAFLESIKAAAR